MKSKSTKDSFWENLDKEFSHLSKKLCLESNPLPYSFKPKKKILIVDDEEEYAFILSNVLKKEFALEYAVNLKEAWEKYKTFLPDLIILDLNLPDGMGTDLVEKIRDRIPKTSVFIFLHTAEAIEDVGAFKKKHLLNEILFKPIPNSKVLKLCTSFLK